MATKKGGKAIEMAQYSKLREESTHGSKFSIQDEEDDTDLESAHDPSLPGGSEGPESSRGPADCTKPENSCSLWNTLTFAWMQPLLNLGNTKPLDLDDLYVLPEGDRAENIYKRFKRAWTNQLHEPEPSLTWAFGHSFGRPFMAAAGLKLIHDSCLFLGPLLLNKIITFLSSDEPLSIGLLYVAGLFVANFTMSLCLRQYFYHCYRVGMNLRSAVVTAVYNKALVISTSTMSRKTTGEISNLMSVDSSRLQDLTPYLHALWYSLFQIVLALLFLWRQLGISCLSGMAVIVISIPVTSKVSSYMKTLQKALSKVRDERIKLTNEVLSGIKVIKLQAWEAEFMDRIHSVRRQEQAIFKKYTVSQAMSGALFTTIPLLVSIVTFTTYIALGNELDVATALTSLALFDLLRFPLFMLPQVMNNVIEAKVSVDRVQSFLLEEEHTQVPAYPLKTKGILINKASLVYDAVLQKKYIASHAAPKVKSDLNSIWRNLCGRKKSAALPGQAQVTNPLSASAASSPASPAAPAAAVLVPVLSADAKQLMIRNALLQSANERIDELEAEISRLQHPDVPVMVNPKEDRLLTLSRVSLQLGPGQLMMVIGSVGAGKSSLLHSLLGNLHLADGTVALHGRIAYTAQLPFITNSTVKENILYGEPFDARRYEETLGMCALSADLAVLPAGDLTEIGERGINLSGGQKARIALARAVYSDADVYLLDDPLSAVDAHVGQHLFEECILALVKANKCVLLVTNALQYVRFASEILILKDGTVAGQGTADDLLAGNAVFAEMMASMNETMSGVSTTCSPVPKASTSSKTAAAGAGASSKSTGKLIGAEEREVGNVDSKIYLTWAAAAGGLSVGLLIIFNFYLGEGIAVSSSWWLSYWSEHAGHGRSPWFYLIIYILINVLTVGAAFWKEIYVRFKALTASTLLFDDLVRGILYAPMAFFDTTPLGRVINRFSKDIYTIDEQIPQTIRGYLSTIAKVTGVLLYICVVTPFFITGLLPIAVFYVLAQKYYIRTSRELTRIESITRSPIYALFSESLDGLATIRAYGTEARLLVRNNSLLDANQRAYFLNFSANCWLAVRLEFVGTLIVSFAALFAVLSRQYRLQHDSAPSVASNAAFAGLAGLSISLALSVTQSLNWTVRMASDMESQMVSVERVKGYSNMEQEPAHYLPNDPSTSSAWPRGGAISFQHVCMRYRPNLPLVLNDLTISIGACEKVGIVGRTGAGKSSLLTVLLRLVELESGSILIDGTNIAGLGLHTLRSAMAVIAQDPVLFSGSIRSNLDPFNKYTDTEVWESIRRCLLTNCVSSLEDKVSENGANYSVGQRQLLCIARALLAKAKIIVMDEATAAVDVETDALIQKTIRSEFAHATCLTVAHRLNTILDSDKVLVMDQGRAAEYDTPANLLANDQSLFYALVANWESSNQ